VKPMNLEQEFSNFCNGCHEAPEGTYEDAKAVRQIISDAMDDLQAGLKAAGLKVNQSAAAHTCEAVMYQYVKQSNPDAYFLITAEGFGEACYGPARERVIEGAASDRDFLRSMGTT
jgi:hypothetical protein